MGKKIMYITMSLNGKIARNNRDVDWLESIPNPTKNDYGYHSFYNEMDFTIQRYKTYKQVANWGIDFPYPDTENYVFTTKQNLKNIKDVNFIIKEHLQLVKDLKAKGNTWIIGGGMINTMLLNSGLLDELRIFVMPVVLPDGKELFGGTPLESRLKLTETITHPNGVLELRYTYYFSSSFFLDSRNLRIL